jgi:hypothetical protein
MEILIGLVFAGSPLLMMGGLLWVWQRFCERRKLWIARQIELTDAIHCAFGAAAAPTVTRSWSGVWTVTMAVDFERASLVGSLARITDDFFERRELSDASRLRIVLTRRERRWMAAVTNRRNDAREAIALPSLSSRPMVERAS